MAGGATSLGIRASDGVIIATEKKLPSALVDETTVQKIAVITPNIGVVYSGMGPDYRVLVRKARKSAQAYYSLYKEHIPVAQLVREVAAVMQEFTREYRVAYTRCRSAALPQRSAHTLAPCPGQRPAKGVRVFAVVSVESGGVRPFGVSLMLAGFDDNGPQLYQIDPSGSYFAWKASAIGKNMVNAKTFLEKRYSDEVSVGKQQGCTYTGAEQACEHHLAVCIMCMHGIVGCTHNVPFTW